MKTRGMTVLLWVATLTFAFGCGDSGSDSPGIFTSLAEWWSGDDAAVEPAVVLAPAAPSGLGASATSAFTADLTWSDNSSNETGFKIMRQRGSRWSLAGRTAPNATSFTDPNLRGGKTYNYRILSFNAYGRSGWSNTVTITTPAMLPLIAPTGVGGSATGSRSINVTWTDASNNESGFKVEKETSGAWAQIAIVGMGVTHYEATGLIPSYGYRFRVRAYNSAGLSDYGTSAVIAAAPDTTPPTGPALTATASGTRINLAWTAATDDFQLSAYWLYREDVRITTTLAAVRTYADLSVPSPALDYCYVVASRDVAGNMTPSNEACAYTSGLSVGLTVHPSQPFGGLSPAFDGANFLVDVLHSAPSGGYASAQLINTKGELVRALSTADGGGGMVSVTWTGTNYLMVWDEDDFFSSDFVGQYFGADGDTVGSVFVIDGRTATNVSAVAGPGGKVLVAYTTEYNSSTHEGDLFVTIIDGRTVSTPVTLTSDTVSAESFGQSWVDFNGTNWLVAYVPIYAANGFDADRIEGRMVSPSLSIGAPLTINPPFAGVNGLVGVGYGNGKFLVAYSETADMIEATIYGQMVTASGLTASLSGGARVLSTRDGVESYPGIAYGGSNFLVVFASETNDLDHDGVCDPGEGTCIDLYGQKVANDGSLVGSNFLIDGSPLNQVGGIAFGAGRYLISAMNYDIPSGAGTGYISARFMTP